MKFLTLSVFAASVSAVFQVRDVETMLGGMLNGLLDVNLDGQLAECTVFIDDAEEKVELGMEIMKQTDDFWMPLDKKVTLFFRALNTWGSVFDVFFRDMKNCDLGKDTEKVEQWIAMHEDFMDVVGEVSKNVLAHGFQLSGKVVQATGDFNNENWRQFGQDVGEAIDLLINVSHQ